MANFQDQVDKISKSARDYTSKMDAEDVKNNQGIVCILSYISWLFLVPLFMAKDSKFARFHVNQGCVLAIVETIVGLVFGLLSGIPAIGLIFSILGGVAGICCLALTIIGILNVINGRAKELPVIGLFRFIK